MSGFLTVRGLEVALSGEMVLRGVDLDLAEGACLSILGSSGSGKTTLLRAIAGLTGVDRGRIELSGRILEDGERRISLPCDARRVGIVFQDLALFPHLSVGENVEYGLRSQPRDVREQRRKEVLGLVGLNGLESRLPHQISGGQQQRVALARALAPQPQLILLDEPFSSLDAALRRELSVEVRGVLRRAGTSAILVSHDLDEAFDFGDRVALLESGEVLQCDRGSELYARPLSLRAARALSELTELRIEKIEGKILHLEGGLRWESPISLPAGLTHWLLRPEELCVVLGGSGAWEAQPLRRLFRRSGHLVEVRLAGGALAWVWDEGEGGEPFGVVPRPKTLKCVDAFGKIWSANL